VVLAAGRGARLGGVDKAALVHPSGDTFLGAITETARAAGIFAIVVVGAPPFASAVAGLAQRYGIAFVGHAQPERGMAHSFAAGLAALPPLVPRAVGAALIWPVDHPGVRAPTIAALLAAATPSTFVVPDFGGRGGHPTLVGADHFDACTAAARDLAGDGLRQVLRQRAAASVTRLATDDPGVVRDVDSSADYAMITV
jgi:nicotine blue oxidoreductase